MRHRAHRVLRLPAFAVFVWAAVAWAVPALADDAGQADLDRATDLKLSAQTVGDLGKVIDLCDSAIKAGLDESNTQLAKDLRAGTLLQRAEIIAAEIFERPTPPPTWPQLRQLAIEDLKTALEHDPKQPMALFALARLQALPGGDRQKARKALTDTIESAGNETALKTRALILRAALVDDVEQRKADFDEAVKIAPRDPAARRARGLFLLTQRKPTEALADFDAAIAAAPDDAESHATRGAILFLQKNFDESLKSLNRATELEPDAAEPYLNRARVYAVLEKNEEALAELDRLEKVRPDLVNVALLRARVLQQSGESAKALAEVERVLRERPGLREAIQLHAALSAGSGKIEAAIDELEELQKKDPKNTELLYQLAVYYSEIKKPDKVIEVLTQLLAADDKSLLAYRARADAYLNQGRQAEAIQDYEAALKIDARDSGVLNNLAWVLATSPEEKLRDGKRSIELGQRACEVTDYKEAHIISTLAAGYAETGDFDSAIKWSRRALEDGSDELKPQLTKELESYERGKPWRELHPDKPVVEEEEDDEADGSSRTAKATKDE